MRNKRCFECSFFFFGWQSSILIFFWASHILFLSHLNPIHVDLDLLPPLLLLLLDRQVHCLFLCNPSRLIHGIQQFNEFCSAFD